MLIADGCTLVADGCEIDFRQQDFLFVSGCIRNEFTHRTGDEGAAPEFDALPAGGRFVPGAVHSGDITPVGHRMAALNDFP